MSWILTYTGQKIDPLKPEPGKIALLDIAHALSNICRFTGHSSSFYSVAQHSLLVAKLCDPEYRLEGLLHDAPEAYLNDIARPLKRTGEFKFYREIEAAWWAAIQERYDLDTWSADDHIKLWDEQALILEGECFMASIKDWQLPPKRPEIQKLAIRAVSPIEAKQAFLKTFNDLWQERTIGRKPARA